MVREAHFRKLLPIAQTLVAAVFGGWGLWLRDSIIRNSLGWNSTLRFHVWPWPFKFAAVLNMPALVVGLLLSWPLEILRPGLPESVSTLPTLLFVPLLWYWVGSWADRTTSSRKNGNSRAGLWILFLIFTLVCAAASSISKFVGSYTSYVGFGIAIWLILAVGVTASAALRKRKSKVG